MPLRTVSKVQISWMFKWSHSQGPAWVPFKDFQVESNQNCCQVIWPCLKTSGCFSWAVTVSWGLFTAMLPHVKKMWAMIFTKLLWEGQASICSFIKCSEKLVFHFVLKVYAIHVNKTGTMECDTPDNLLPDPSYSWIGNVYSVGSRLATLYKDAA